jgi:hypothetical protein
MHTPPPQVLSPTSGTASSSAATAARAAWPCPRAAASRGRCVSRGSRHRHHHPCTTLFPPANLRFTTTTTHTHAHAHAHETHHPSPITTMPGPALVYRMTPSQGVLPLFPPWSLPPHALTRGQPRSNPSPYCTPAVLLREHDGPAHQRPGAQPRVPLPALQLPRRRQEGHLLQGPVAGRAAEQRRCPGGVHPQPRGLRPGGGRRGSSCCVGVGWGGGCISHCL